MRRSASQPVVSRHKDFNVEENEKNRLKSSHRENMRGNESESIKISKKSKKNASKHDPLHGLTPLMRLAASPDDSAALISHVMTEEGQSSLFEKDSRGHTALDWARIHRNFTSVSILLQAMNTAIHNVRVLRLSEMMAVDKIKAASDNLKLHELIRQTNSAQAEQLMIALRKRDADWAAHILEVNQLSREEVEGLSLEFFTDGIGFSGGSLTLQRTVGMTPLMYASAMGMSVVVHELIRLGTPVDATNGIQQTALTVAAASGHEDIVRFLLFHGADVFHATREGRTALHYACLYAKYETVKVLLGFLLERAAHLRIENHSLTEYDPSRWLQYTISLRNLIEARDENGKTCQDLIPTGPQDPFSIEKRLRVSSKRVYDRLYQRTTGEDASLQTWRDFADDPDELDQPVAELLIGKTEDESDKMHENKEEYDDDIDDDASGVSALSMFSLPEWSHNTDSVFVETTMLQPTKSLPTSSDANEILKSLDEARQRISLWEANAAKEAELVKVIPCVLDCGEHCRVEDMSIHIRSECLNRTVQCSICHQISRFRELDYHIKKSCAKRKVPCPNSYEGCYEWSTADTLALHLKLHCSRRIVSCRQHCGAELRLYMREDHEQNHCSNRVLKCDKCYREMLACVYPSHLQNECPERLVKCTVSCGEYFLARELEDHENSICRIRCKWDCGLSVGPPSRRMYHEQHECPSMPIICCFPCGRPSITARWRDYHEEQACMERLERCSYGCGEWITASQMNVHVHPYQGNCPLREVYCPSNLVGFKLYDMEEEREGIVIKYDRNPEGVDLFYCRFSTRHKYIPVFGYPYTLLERVTSQEIQSDGALSTEIANTSFMNDDGTRLPDVITMKCGTMMSYNLEHHLWSLCPYRKVFLVGDVEQSVGLSGQSTQLHNAYQMAEARVNVGDLIDGSSDTKRPCEYCCLSYPIVEMQHHLDTECTNYLVFCPIACGQKIYRRTIPSHVADHCMKRIVPCPMCDVDDLWAEELDDHVANRCPMRPVVCSLGCDATVLAFNETNHLLNECANRKMQCTCGMSMNAQHLEVHKKFDCNDRMVICPQGCGESIPHYQLENHLEIICKSRRHQYDKMTECPNGCGISMMQKELLLHTASECPLRIVECPQLCGQIHNLDRLREHFVVCPNRMITCKPGLHVCEKPLFNWFCSESAASKMTRTRQNAKKTLAITNGEEVSLDIDDDDEDDDEEMLCDEAIQAMSAIPNPPKRRVTPKFGLNLGAENTNNQVTLGGSTMEIDFTMDEGVNIFTSIRVRQRNNQRKLNNSNGDDDSSIFMEGSTIHYKDSLRLLSCSLHGFTLLMIAVNQNDFHLAEVAAKRISDKRDFQLENIFGDTALTLACRLMRIDFVELLIQHGADVNYETSNGKTAIIEAVKATEENIELIECLLCHGCFAAYKTARHNRSSLDWARRYALSEYELLKHRALAQFENPDDPNIIQTITSTTAATKVIADTESISLDNQYTDFVALPDVDVPQGTIKNGEFVFEMSEEKRRILGRPQTVRILELAAIVESQSSLLFTQIALGNSAWVSQLVDDGDMFDPNNETQSYDEMKNIAAEADEMDRKAVMLQERLLKLDVMRTANVDKGESIKEYFKDAESQLAKFVRHEQLLDKLVSLVFSQYERSSMRITAVELDEILQCAEPPLALVIACFTLGYVFELINMNELSSTLRNGIEDICNLIDLGSPLPNGFPHDEIKKIAPSIISAITAERKIWFRQLAPHLRDHSVLLRKLHIFSKARVNTSPENPLFKRSLELLVIFFHIFFSSQSTKKDVDVPSSTEPMVNVDDEPDHSSTDIIVEDFVAATTPLPKPTYETDEIPDWFWDPDAVMPCAGKWVKGEWQPSAHTTEKWWERLEDWKKNRLQEQQVEKDTSKVVIISDPDIQAVTETSALVSASKTETSFVNSIQNSTQNISENSSAPVHDNSEVDIYLGYTEHDYDTDLVNILQELLEHYDEESYSLLTLPLLYFQCKPSAYGSLTVSQNGEIRKSSTPVADDLIIGYSLFDTMIRLLRSIVTTVVIAPKVATARLESSRVSADLEHTYASHEEDLRMIASVHTRISDSETRYVKVLRSARFLREKAAKWKEKVRVARLLNRVSASGHTATSWAASHGQFEITDILLRRGGSAGPTSNLCHMASRVIQAAVQIYLYKMRESYEEVKLSESETTNRRSLALSLQHNAQNTLEENYEKMKRKKLELPKEYRMRASTVANRVAVLRRVNQMRESLVRRITEFRYYRRNLRFPIPEAVYAGKWEIVRHIFIMGWHHYNFFRTWLYPRPPPPFICLTNRMARLGISKRFPGVVSRDYLTINEIFGFAVNDLGSGIYFVNDYSADDSAINAAWMQAFSIEDVSNVSKPMSSIARDFLPPPMKDGWISVMSRNDPYGEMQVVLQLILRKIFYNYERFHDYRYRVRILRNEEFNQVDGEYRMRQKIDACDFFGCMELAMTRGITMDLETASGKTLLIAAAEEDSNSLNHEFMRNDDGKECLVVEYLLDRFQYRPSVDLESSHGITALNRAAYLGRNDVLCALLDRGAIVNYQNKDGKTALHFATMSGHSRTVQLLLERNADVSIVDSDGKTAFQHAEEANFVDLCRILSLYQCGNLGTVSMVRGSVESRYFCPRGCGKVLFPHEKDNHLASLCSMRIVPCPLGCHDETIVEKDCEAHTLYHCPRRLVNCEACKESCRAEDLPYHLGDECRERLIPCERLCGRMIKAYEQGKHSKLCHYRLISCPKLCGLDVRWCDQKDHLETDCVNRLLPCPWKCRTLVPAKELEKHKSQNCPNRMVSCPTCEQQLPHRLIDSHITEECVLRCVECTLKCGAKIRVRDVSHHVAELCPRRLVICPLQCGRKMVAVALKHHTEKECDNRMIPCPNNCCALPPDQLCALWKNGRLNPSRTDPNDEPFPFEICTFSAQVLPSHVKLECPLRPVRCHACLKSEIASIALADHQANECLWRTVECTHKGCMKTLALKDLEHHQAAECRFRTVSCPQACGAEMLSLYVSSHLLRDCPRRKVSCTRGCGDEVRWEELNDHLDNACVRRGRRRITNQDGIRP